MAWGKRVRLVVGNGSSEDADLNAVDLSDLDIQFRVLRSNVFGNSRAEFTVWNVSPETETACMRTDFTDVNFWAGYSDGEYGMLFAGHVLDIHPEWSGANRKLVLTAIPLRANGYTEEENKKIQIDSPEVTRIEGVLVELETQLDILKSTKVKKGEQSAKMTKINNLEGLIREAKRDLADAKKQKILSAAGQVVLYQIRRETQRISANTYISLSYAPNTPVSTLIETVGLAIGIKPHIPSEYQEKLINGYTASKSLKSILRDIERILQASNWAMYFDLREWVIYDWLNRKQFVEVVVFDPDSGLLSVAPSKRYEYDPDRPQILAPKKTWDITTLLHPAVSPNSVIYVNTKDNNGMAKMNEYVLVESVEFIGDNAGGQYTSNIVVSSQK